MNYFTFSSQFAQWINRKSIGFSITDQLLIPMTINGSAQYSSNQETLELFGVHTFEFAFDTTPHSSTSESCQITDIHRRIIPDDKDASEPGFIDIENLHNLLLKDKSSRLSAQMLFCGGPI